MKTGKIGRVLIFGLAAVLLLSCSSDKSTEPKENQPPAAPSQPSPAEAATLSGITVTLSWQCTDPDGDSIRCDLYFDTAAAPSLESTGLSAMTFLPGPLQYGTAYYWKVVAKDGHGHETEGPVWSFTAGQEPAPQVPSNPSPADNSTDQHIFFTFYWECSDSGGDLLDFDVCLGTTANPPVIAQAPDKFYTLSTNLVHSTAYFWKVIAHDNHGHATSSPLWQFATAAAPRFQISPTSLYFYAHEGGIDPAPAHITIANAGGDRLEYTTMDTISWLTLTNLIGQAPATLDAQASIAGLQQGLYTGQVLLACPDAANTPQQLPCSLLVGPPQILWISSAILDGGDTTTVAMLLIRNQGTGTLTWSASSDESWLVPQTLGWQNTTTETDTLILSFIRYGLPPGAYSAHLAISSNAGDTVANVLMTVPWPPQPNIEPESLNLCFFQPNGQMFVRNTGGGLLDWNVSSDQPWVNLTPGSGITTGETDTVAVSIDLTGLSPAYHTAVIRLSSGADSDSAVVSVTVRSGAAQIAFVPSSRILSVRPHQSGYFLIRNDGGQPLTWSVYMAPDDVYYWPSGGTTTCETDTLWLSGGGDYSNQDYAATISISSNSGGSTSQIPIYFQWHNP